MRVTGQARSGSSRKRSGPSLPGPAAGARTLLNPATDLTPVGTGYFDVVDGNGEGGNGACLAGRYVSGTFRLMFLETGSRGLYQFTVPASITGQTLNFGSGGGSTFDFSGVFVGTGNAVGNIDGGTAGFDVGLWWDETRQLLWFNNAEDYVAVGVTSSTTTSFSNFAIDATGTVTNRTSLGLTWTCIGLAYKSSGGSVTHVQDWAVTVAGSRVSSLQSGSVATLTGGHTVLVYVWVYDNTTVTSVTDTVGNTYVQDATAIASDNTARCDVWRSSNVSGGSTVRITVHTAASAFITFAASAFSGMANASPLDGVGSFASGASLTTIAPGPFTTTNANDLLISTFTSNGTDVIESVPTGFTSAGSQASGGASGEDGGVAYKIVSATQSGIDPSWAVAQTPTWGGWGLEGTGNRAHYGGVRRVPTWFQTAYGAYEYMTGFGGYTSLAGQGLGASYGPFLATFPYPNGVYTVEAPNQQSGGIPTSDFKILMDCRGGVADGSCWYPNVTGGGYAARTADRGPRLTTDVTNWFDSSDSRSNPTTSPTYPTDFAGAPPGQWWTGNGGGPAGGSGHTPPNDGDPDGWNRWTWGDTYGNNMVWIDNDAGTRTKHGILVIACLNQDYAYYANSTLNHFGLEYEAHVYDPAVLATSTGLGGSTPPYAIRPTNLVNFTSQMPDVVTDFGSGNGRLSYHVWGVVYDPTAERLYVICYGIPNGINAVKARVYVYAVAT